MSVLRVAYAYSVHCIIILECLLGLVLFRGSLSLLLFRDVTDRHQLFFHAIFFLLFSLCVCITNRFLIRLEFFLFNFLFIIIILLIALVFFPSLLSFQLSFSLSLSLYFFLPMLEKGLFLPLFATHSLTHSLISTPFLFPASRHTFPSSPSFHLPFTFSHHLRNCNYT